MLFISVGYFPSSIAQGRWSVLFITIEYTRARVLYRPLPKKSKTEQRDDADKITHPVRHLNIAGSSPSRHRGPTGVAIELGWVMAVELGNKAFSAEKE